MSMVFWEKLSLAVFGEYIASPDIRFNARLAGPLPVSELLAETVGLAGIALARLCARPFEQVEVDGRLCVFWGLTSCRPIGWTPPEPWDPLSTYFRGADGWIRLHANAPRHKTAVLRVLGGVETREAVADAISRRPVAVLEREIIAENGAAARMIPWRAWQEHAQGRAVAQSPLVEWTEKPVAAPDRLRHADFGSERPLSGIRVLDLTRVLAGPVATRMLAGFGAQVLRIDPPDWDDPGLLQDTTIGKRCAELDLKSSAGRSRFEDLLSKADILVHGFRPGALGRLGYDSASLDRINPARIEASLSAYGWHGPWAGRRGFDSLVQFSSGIADICGDGRGKPGMLPLQALDHAAGHVMAASLLEALHRARAGRIVSARICLARIAMLLCQARRESPLPAFLPPLRNADFSSAIECSDWGRLKRLRPPLSVPGVPLRWDIPSGNLRRHPPEWKAPEWKAPEWKAPEWKDGRTCS